ncbi:hypothetical protein [Bacillus infantis]|uniref:Uncharacterized protein n=1 Tax=Bacillus infantis TaxID=324767 RepID=A0A5D4R7Z0_9BACI|nr:hypothetical protein [Bacillus infantis]TYS46730.1 hypothetical protein FZD51_14760 [Bacillus infantis]
MHFGRILNLTELEAWDIFLDNRTYRMIIIDEKRASTPADFSQEDHVLSDEMKSNIIKAEVYSEEKVLDDHIYHLDQLAKSFTDHLAHAHCHVRMNFSVGDIECALNDHIKRKIGCSCEEIPMERFFYLNQDLDSNERSADCSKNFY